MTSLKSNDEIRDSVRTAYADVVETASGCCGPDAAASAGAGTSCCPTPDSGAPTDGRVLGYGEDEIKRLVHDRAIGTPED